MNQAILVIDDEPAQRQTLAGFLKKKGFTVEQADSGDNGIKIIRKNAIDLVLTDYKMPDKNGLEVLKEVKTLNPDIDVIVMTAYGSIESATEAMKAGAIDYLTKPINLDELELILQRAFDRKLLISENQALKKQLAEKFRFSEIISESLEMENVLNTAARVAPSVATALIRGESGTGKELVARAIHYASPRKNKPFVAVNCAALSENLLESELFGHERGAFTGADRQRKGRFEMANSGTLFLDEIGEIPPSTQVKLLRVLQEKTFERVGGSESIKVDVRLITATNRDLEKMLTDNTFREDLYYRLNVVTIAIPPLRKRKTDIGALVPYFLNKYSKMNGKNINSLSREAMDLLVKYDFPGNVRELENIIEQAVVLARDNTISTNDLPLIVRGLQSEIEKYDTKTGTFEARVAAFEKNLISEALHIHNGVQTKAAEMLGMTERHLRYKLKKYEMK